MAYTWTYSSDPNGYIYSAAIQEMRNKINEERNRRGKGTYAFVQPISAGSKITTAVLNEIRTAAMGIRPNFTPSPAPTDATKFFDSYMDEMKAHLNNLNNEGQSIVYKDVPVFGYNYGEWYYSKDSSPLYYVARMIGGMLPGWLLYYNGVVKGWQLPGVDGIADGRYYCIERVYNSNLELVATNPNVIFQIGDQSDEVSGSDKYGNYTWTYFKIRRGEYGIIGYNTVVDYYYWP